MKDTEKEIYNNNLSEYSSIIKQRTTDKEKITECLKMFEYFEDYEKCKDLDRILKNLDN
jgi:hypothetical protein